MFLQFNTNVKLFTAFFLRIQLQCRSLAIIGINNGRIYLNLPVNLFLSGFYQMGLQKETFIGV